MFYLNCISTDPVYSMRSVSIGAVKISDLGSPLNKVNISRITDQPVALVRAR